MRASSMNGYRGKERERERKLPWLRNLLSLLAESIFLSSSHIFSDSFDFKRRLKMMFDEKTPVHWQKKACINI